jgi:uncharacterized membrane-anchored protein
MRRARLAFFALVAATAGGEGGTSRAAEPATRLPWINGPQAIDLGYDVTLRLPDRDSFLGPAEARRLLERLGNFHNGNVLGIVASGDPHATWFVTVRYDAQGYVKDNGAFDNDELLSALITGTEEANRERRAHGFKALHVTGWSQPPRYDRALHRLAWALRATSDNGESVNFNTRVLGRKGSVSLDLVCDPAELAADKPEVVALLEGTAFRSGARYEDFDAKSDPIAQDGLTGSILAGAGLGAAKGKIAALGQSALTAR